MTQQQTAPQSFKEARQFLEQKVQEINQAYERLGKTQRVILNPETFAIDTIIQ